MRLFTPLAAALILVAPALPAAAEPTTTGETSDYQAVSPTLGRLQRDLAELNRWLGPDANGRRWRAYLHSKRLEEQMARRGRANPAVVASILARYRGGAAGLGDPHFAQVRAGLTAWLGELQRKAAEVPSREQLPALARNAQDKFHPLRAEDVREAKQRVIAAARALDNFLMPGTPNTRAWKEYLHWNQLQTQLRAEEPDLRQLGEVYRQLRQNEQGLELPVFRNLAAALRHYGDLAPLAGQPGLEKWYAGQLDKLATALEQYPEQPTLENREVIALSLGRFASLNLAPRLVHAARHHYVQPNFWAELSRPLLAVGFRDQISRPVSISDCILGTSIVGQGYTTGDVDLNLIPDYRRAILENYVTANTTSNTQGFNRVTIYSAGNTALAARKWILLETTGVWSPDATATAVTNTATTGISGGHLVRHIASKRIAQSRPQSNAVASQHAAARLERAVDAQAARRVAEANAAYQTQFRDPLLRLGEFPQLLGFNTRFDALTVVALKADRDQLGAPAGPPPRAGAFDLLVRVHETLPNNYAESLLGGRTYQSEEVKRQIVELRGELPEQLRGGENEEPWSITFARRNPITLDFGDGQFTVTIRGQRYTSGDRQFGAMNVGATYRVARGEGGLRLVRQGELAIFPPGFDRQQGRLGVGDVALRTILQRKFSRLFPEEVALQGLELPGRWAKAGKLQPALMQSRAGWLQVGWNLESAERGMRSAE